MKFLSRTRLLLNCLAVLALAPAASAQPAGKQIISPEVKDDHRVTFRLAAPNAKDVKLDGDLIKKPLAMTKDGNGVWSVTTEPLEPNVYGYFFVVDGTNFADPSNTFVRVG